MDKLLVAINARLEDILDTYQNSKVKEAMKYSLNAGGKRIRPLLMLQVIRSYDQDCN